MTDQDKLALGEKRAKELGLEMWTVFDCTETVKNALGDRRTSKCPRCKDAWLSYRADDIHRLLGEGVEMHGDSDEFTLSEFRSTACMRDADMGNSRALLIGIRPLVQESEERKLLREFVAWWKSADYPPDFLDRARKLLERP